MTTTRCSSAKDSDATLLLLRARWDDEKEASEFSDVYRRVLAVKYPDGHQVQSRVVQKGVDVFIVEGGDKASTDTLLKVVKSAKPRRN